MSAYGILLPCDGTEPLPVSVGNYDDIVRMVGGYIDAVRFDFDRYSMDVLEAPVDADEFVAVGYINDTGMVDGLPVNAMASIVFGRELFGPVVVVSGTNPNGVYDGDNYDVPEWFCEAVFNHGLHTAATLVNKVADIEAGALALAIADGLFTSGQVALIERWIMSEDPKHFEALEAVISIAVVYKMGRESGVFEKFDRDKYESWADAMFKISDDEIEQFWGEETGN